jgi:hypothetical protein
MPSALIIEIAKGAKKSMKGKPKDEPYEDEDEAPEAGKAIEEAKASAAADMFAAVKKDDQEAFAVALEEYVSACMGK